MQQVQQQEAFETDIVSVCVGFICCYLIIVGLALVAGSADVCYDTQLLLYTQYIIHTHCTQLRIWVRKWVLFANNIVRIASYSKKEKKLSAIGNIFC